mmetsp:Transcript_5113/g.7516  ORF Transcript_5113/g.7516 Transcript_5113/m.7516 type:complete len:215 (-) Transcript_5113:977-1621(-)
MCANGFPSRTKFCKNRAAVMEPPHLVPIFFKSAIFDSSNSLYSSGIGILQVLSPVTSDALLSSFARSSSFENTPAYFFPSAIMQDPVRVDNSIILSHPTSWSAYTNASAKVSLPSASVFNTSIVLPFDATRISLGTYALALIMFSHAATQKCTSIPGGAKAAIAFAAPKTAAAPPQSNFMSSIIAVLMLYPPVSNKRPFPTTPSLRFTTPSLGV